MTSITDLGARDAEGRPIGRPAIDTIYDGRRVRAVGRAITFRPPEETDQEFFVHVLAHTMSATLGEDWKAKQDELPETERHPLALWVDAWDELGRDRGAKARDVRDEGGGRYSATATGDALALLTLAYDVYALRHAMAIEVGDPLIKRLGQKEQFQGARYEVAVAAIFVRAGYRIEWLADSSRKLPEFIARRGGSDAEISVEAKSRPRPGLLGQAGERPSEESVKADLARLHRDALEKETDGRPYVVFLDMNSPAGQDKTFEEWVPTLHEDVLAWRGESSAENPDPFSAVVLTNFSWHWHGDEDAPTGERFLVLPLYAVMRLPDSETTRIWEAVNDYGRRAYLALWTSRTGTAWRRIGGSRNGPVGAFVDLAATSTGLLALAFEPGRRGLVTTVWASRRGAWRPVAELGPGIATGLCAGPHGVVAVAAATQEPGTRIKVWSRPPGRPWSVEAEVVASRAAVSHCADGPKGTVLVGGDENFAAVSWTRTRPGERWVKSVVGSSEPRTEILDVIRDGSGFLATGTSGGRGQADLAIWRSPDGARWVRLAEADPISLEPGYQAGVGIVKISERLVVVGQHGAGNAGIWTGTP